MTTEPSEPIEEVDIEEFARAGRPIPHARHYRYRVNKERLTSTDPTLTREQILESARLTPESDYRLRLKRRNGPPREVKPGETIDLRAPGVERFVANRREVQDGLAGRRQFTLPAEDVEFLDGLGLEWEAIVEGDHRWVIIDGVALPSGFTVTVVDVAIEILAGYATTPLDMAYFHPHIARSDGRAIPNADSMQSLDGKTWQRWSRHRVDGNRWTAGVDNLETHFAYMLDWFTRELAR